MKLHICVFLMDFVILGKIHTFAIMNLSLFIARRLSFRVNRNNRRSPGIAVAVAGVAIAIVVMLVTLSVVMGFKHSIRDKVAGFDSQLAIAPIGADGMPEPFAADATIKNMIADALGGDVEISENISTTALLKTENDFLGVTMRGDSYGSFPSRFVEENIVAGAMPDFGTPESRNDLVISEATAGSLGIDVGDKLLVYFVDGENVRTRRMTVAALYNTSFGERDKLLAYCSLDFLRGVCAMDSSDVGKLCVDNLDYDNLNDASAMLQQRLADGFYSGELPQFYHVDNVYHSGAVYFSWLELLDTNVVVIILLMSIVAAFTLISCLFILILERVGMIGLLKAIGASNSVIRNIFVYMALRVVLVGLAIGNIVGLIILSLQERWHILPLDPSSYYLPYVPVEINWIHVLILNAVALIVAWLVLIMPTMIISRISPSLTMRYE